MTKRYAYFYVMTREPERIREIAPRHAAYWHGLGLEGYVGGPFAERDGGLITFEAQGRDEAERAVEGDPFVRERVLRERWIREWMPDLEEVGRVPTRRH